MSTVISDTTRKYPFFDLSEIIQEPDFAFKPQQSLTPVRTGNRLPGLAFKSGYKHWQQFFNGAETHGPVILRQLLNKPLVISFYSPEWQQHATDQLKQLNSIRSEMMARGGNLLVIAAGRDRELEKLVWDNSLSLIFYFDSTHEIARSLRIFDETKPAWSWFSGIDINVPLPATYVIDASGQVVYDHVNLNKLSSFSSDDVLSAVYESSLVANLRRSA
jgi:peroxiredoxin